MGREGITRWLSGLALGASVCALGPLALAAVVSLYARDGRISLGAMLPVLFVLVTVGIGAAHRKAAALRESALDEVPGGAAAGHSPWLRAAWHGVMLAAEISAVWLVLVTPHLADVARAVVLALLFVALLPMIALDFYRRRWALQVRDGMQWLAVGVGLTRLESTTPIPHGVANFAATLGAGGLVLALFGALAISAARALRRRSAARRRAGLLARAGVPGF